MEFYVDIIEVNYCRVCNSAEGSVNILTDCLDEGGVLLHEALEFITCLEVDADDGMSLWICTSCRERLLDAYRFKNQALDSYKSFHDPDSSVHHTKLSLVDEDDVHLESAVFVGEATESLPDEFETDKETENKSVIDNSTDAVSFLIAHHKKTAREKSSSKTKPSDDDCVKNKPEKNTKTKNKHECKVCQKKFRKKSNLVDHLRLHANVKNFTCSYCDKSFVQIGNYRQHLRIHTKERPYVCPVCNKSYNQSGSLKIHIRSHTQERNYICDECDKGFTNLTDLNKHKRLHDPSQQFKCEFCGKSFAQKVNMRVHQRNYHRVQLEASNTSISVK